MEDEKTLFQRNSDRFFAAMVDPNKKFVTLENEDGTFKIIPIISFDSKKDKEDFVKGLSNRRIEAEN